MLLFNEFIFNTCINSKLKHSRVVILKRPPHCSSASPLTIRLTCAHDKTMLPSGIDYPWHV